MPSRYTATPSQRSIHLVGRSREQEMLRHALDEALGSRGGLVLVSGEAGIGKTTLVRWLIEEAQASGALVLTGGCYDLTTTPPYGPWIEVLRGYPANERLPPMPEQLWEGTGLEGIHSQTALFELAGRFFQRVAGTQPLVLLLEDLHWADRGSLELLRHLGRRPTRLPILILATYRDDEITRRDTLFQFMPLLVREASATRVDLQGWIESDIRSFVATRYGLVDRDADELVAYLLDRASGNPLFVAELLHTLESEAVLRLHADGWRIGDLSGVPVPTLIVQLIEGRLRALDSGIRQLLEIAAVIGQEVPLDLWKRVSGASDTELGAALERAVETSILVEGPRELSVRFRHALIREALYSEVGLLQRRDLHRATANVLLEMPRPDPDAVVTHLRPANDPRLADWLVRSGDRAMARFAWDTAVERYAHASGLLELQETSDPLRMCQILLKLGEAQNYAGSGRGRTTGAGNDPEANATFWRVANIAREAGLPEQLGHSAHGIAGTNRAAGHGGPDGVRLMAEALNALPDVDSALRVQLMARLATGSVVLASLQEWSELASVEQVDAWSMEAVAMARRLNDPQTLAYALMCRNSVNVGLYDFEERRANSEEALALAATRDDGPLAAGILYDRVVDPMMTGDLDLARRFFARFDSFVAQLHMPVFDWFAAVHRSGELLSAGLYEDAEQAIEQIDAAWPDSGAAQAQRITLYRELGNPDAMRQVIIPGPSPILYRTLRLLYFLEAGEGDAAREHFQSFIDSGYLSRALPKRSIAWLRIAAVAAETCAALGDDDSAELIYNELIPYEGLNIFAGYAQYSMGAVSHYLGLLATTMADWNTAERHFSRALEQNNGWGFRPAAAYTRYEWARMLADRNQSGDRQRARELLNEALATANTLGMVRLKHLATAFARECGLAKHSHPAGLSSREVEVLQLVADGMTNAEVGEELFISPRTVAQHLRSVYNKLGVNSRAAAVARWVEIGSG